VDRRPVGIAFGEGAIWVAASGDDAVTRIIKVGNAPSGIVFGGDAVWVAVQAP
jgi:hypothetical protein